MKRAAAFAVVLSCWPTSSFSQATFNDLPSYCSAMSEASSATLLARVRSVPRSQAEAPMQGMTDPASIRMVKEVIEFAYSQPASVPVNDMRTELRKRCIARQIFVQ